MLRLEDGINVRAADIEALLKWNPTAEPDTEISFTPPGFSSKTSPASPAS